MVPDQQRLSTEDRSNLVAYLDGELTTPRPGSIATKLTQSVTARREVEALRKTWELLDLLPRPKASEDFTAADPDRRDRGRRAGRPDGLGRLGRRPAGRARAGLGRRLGPPVRRSATS